MLDDVSLPSFGQTPVAVEINSKWSAARGRLWGRHPVAHPVEIRVRDTVRIVGDPSREYDWPKYLPPVFYDHCDGSRREPATWRSIADDVCAKHGITMAQLTSPRRQRNIVHARHEAFFRCSEETRLSLAQIGQRLGGFDHTTVLAGMRRHAQRMGAVLT